MAQFEVGKVYTNRHDSYIRIKRRTDKTVVSVFLNSRGEEYDLGFKYRKVQKFRGVESIYFPIGIGGESFSADEVVEDFDAIVKAELARQEAATEKCKQRVINDAQRLRDFLAEHNISYDLMFECSNMVDNVCHEALVQVGKENDSRFVADDEE